MEFNRSKKYLKAFSLLELSIVIATIAILLAAVISARTIKKNFEQKSFYQELIQIKEKINNFKLIYGYLPGDFPKAGRLFNNILSRCTDEIIDSGFGTNSRKGCNGDGDNNWDSSLVSCCYGEGYMVWLHLQLANLLSAPYGGEEYYYGYQYRNNPQSDANNLYKSKLLHALFLPMEWEGSTSHESTRYPRIKVFNATVKAEQSNAEYGLFSPEELYAIDLKYDDGKPMLGEINAIKGNYTIANSNSCTSGDTIHSFFYNTAHDDKVCDLYFLIRD